MSTHRLPDEELLANNAYGGPEKMKDVLDAWQNYQDKLKAARSDN